MNDETIIYKKCDDEYLITVPSSYNLNNIELDYIPKISFCIPTLNNEDTLDRCLSSIIEQDYPDVEIIIVDGNSTDQTLEIAKKYTNKIFYDSGNLGSARQTSIEKSTGEILALFDSDIYIPHRKWLINAVKCFYYTNDVSTVWPVNIAPPGASLTARLYFNQWKLLMENRINKKKGLYGGGNSLFLRKYIEEIGGVNQNLHWGEDFDWAQKLKDRGYKVVFIQDPLYHDTMQSLNEFIKKQFTGAKTFTVTGFGLMALSFWDVVNEQIFLGIKGMIKGLLIERDISWLLFPIFLLVRIIAYIYTYIINFKHKLGSV